MAATMPRAVRVPDDVWRAALAKAQAEGTTVTAVVVEALRRFAEG
jgi:predicted HicB family RNase H-like nuclease